MRLSGPIISLSVLGTRIVILNSLELLVEGLGKRELAGRPHLVVAGELMDFNRVRSVSHVSLASTYDPSSDDGSRAGRA